MPQVFAPYRLRGHLAGLPHLDGLAVRVVCPDFRMPCGFARVVAMDDPEMFIRYTVPVSSLGPIE